MSVRRRSSLAVLLASLFVASGCGGADPAPLTGADAAVLASDAAASPSDAALEATDAGVAADASAGGNQMLSVDDYNASPACGAVAVPDGCYACWVDVWSDGVGSTTCTLTCAECVQDTIGSGGSTAVPLPCSDIRICVGRGSVSLHCGPCA